MCYTDERGGNFRCKNTNRKAWVMSMKPMTEKQKRIFEYIEEFTQEHGYPPSVREIGAKIGLKSPSTVHVHLKVLAEKGYIKKDDKKTRAITFPNRNAVAKTGNQPK